MGCAMSACSGLTTTTTTATDLADSNDDNHYGKLGVVDIANKCVPTSDQANWDGDISGLECDHSTLHYNNKQTSRNFRDGLLVDDDDMTQPAATTKRKREMRSARASKEIKARFGTSSGLAYNHRKRSRNFSSLLVAIISRGRRHSSSRIDVTPQDLNLKIINQQQASQDSAHSINSPARAQEVELARGEPSARPRPRPQPRPQPRPRSSQPLPGCDSDHLVISSNQLAMTPTIIGRSSDQQAAAAAADEIGLFTSMHQLCYETINCKLIGTSKHARLCLFVFGRPGSSRGELAFELVEHSPLIEFIAQLESGSPSQINYIDYNNNTTGCELANSCPLYHYLDVSALIVANIDARISEYNRLVARTLRSRRQQLQAGQQQLIISGSSESQVSNGECRGELLDEEKQDEEDEEQDVICDENFGKTGARVDASGPGENSSGLERLQQTTTTTTTTTSTSTTKSIDSPAQSPSSSSSSLSSLAGRNDEQSMAGQFSQITMGTKQRSILQLKMIKYACCVTAKWVIHLLRQEINLIEERFACALNERHAPPPRRVYLVNLVPNQVSLFKTCLYLQQTLPLNQLRLPHWAVKFERRTNIKLMINKERAMAVVNQSEGQHHSISLARPTGKRVLIQFKRLSQIKLPNILALGPMESLPSMSTSKVDIINQQNGQEMDESKKNINSTAAAAAAANLLANGPNEKLNPKYHDLFAQQFDSLNKLTRLRYNPSKNYNYLDECHNNDLFNDYDPDESRTVTPTTSELTPTTTTTTTTTNFITKNLCYLKLAHLNDFDHHRPEPASPGSTSHGSSRANSQLMIASESCSSGPIITSYLHSHQFIETPRHCQLSNSASASFSPAPSPSPSPCPSSLVSVDAFSTSSYDLTSYNQLLSTSYAHDPAGRQLTQFAPSSATVGQHQANINQPLKWAVELELIDEQTSRDPIRWYHQLINQTSPSETHSNQSSNELTLATTKTNCCLYVYHNDTMPTRSRSHSSLLLTSSHAATATATATSVVAGTICRGENYYLVATRVAYATGQSQPVLEIKRLHGRPPIKCSNSRSDLNKLRKLISKACVSLTRDLDSWLKKSIYDKHQHQHQHQHLHQYQSVSSNPIYRHHHFTNKSITLITYTIRVDVSKFLIASLETNLAYKRQQVLAEQQQQQQQQEINSQLPLLTFDKPRSSAGSNGDPPGHEPSLNLDPIVQLLQTKPKRSNLAKQRPSSARPRLSDNLVVQSREARALSPDGLSLQLPASTGGHKSASPAGVSTRSSSPRARHVQFKLGQAPMSASNQNNGQNQMGAPDAQKRLWARDILFASCSEPRLYPIMDSLVASLKLN